MKASRVWNILLGIAICSAGWGCATKGLSPREAFLRAHARERQKYLKIWEVSPEALLRASKENYSARRTLVRALREDFGKHPDLVERLNAIDGRLIESSKHEQDYLRELQAEFDPKKDTLFFYVRLDGNQEEDAWIIVRENVIRKKYVLATAEWNLSEEK